MYLHDNNHISPKVRVGMIVLLVICFGIVLSNDSGWSQSVPSPTAENSRNGREKPASFSLELKGLDQIDFEVMPPVDLAEIQREDSLREATLIEPEPYRFAVAIPVEFGLENSGTWEDLPDGSRIWRLRIISKQAQTINLKFNRFDIPEGGKLWLYDPARELVQGPYVPFDRTPKGELWTAMTLGEEMVVELYVPPRSESEPSLVIGSVNHGYRGFGREGKSCYLNINVVCPLGDLLRNEIRSVAKITIAGKGTCSGQLLNNVCQDCLPYFLTARHCLKSADPNSIVFYWNYQSPNCTDVGGGNLADNQTGAVFHAAYTHSDFGLLRLKSRPSPSFNVYYSGWNAAVFIPDHGFCIHHPKGDEKAISKDNGPLYSSDYGPSPVGANYYWMIKCLDQGVLEKGSSGCGVWHYDNGGFLVGQLRGGYCSCDNPTGSEYFGKFSVSWSTGTQPITRLRDWLDPNNTGTLRMPGRNCDCQDQLIENITYSLTEYIVEAATFIMAGENVGAPIPDGPVVVKPDSEVLYQAGDHINLMPGFSVRSGGLFRAIIAPCP